MIPPDDCCTTEDAAVAPTVTTSGYTLSSSAGNSCCHTSIWSPNSTASVQHCCDTLAVHSAEIICTSQDWMVAFDNSVAANSAPCPVSQARCCPVPYQLSEFVETAKLTQTNKFAVDFYRVGRTVVVGKEEIRCDPDTTPVCRWFVRVLDEYRYDASINSEIVNEYSLTNTFLDDCYFVTPSYTNRSTSTTSCGAPDNCDSDLPDGSACKANRGASADNVCFEGNGTFCVQRIKFFDTRPSGSITLLATDTLPASGCDEVACGPKCESWDQEACVSSPSSILPPHWCSAPPTIRRTETTCTPIHAQCASLLSFNTTDCEAVLVACITPTTCTNPATFTRVCERLDFPTWANDPLECRFNSAFPDFFYFGCSCSENEGGMPQCLRFVTRPWIAAEDCGTNCSNTTCCERLLCSDGVTQLWCAFLRQPAGFWWNNDLVVNITCGSYAQKSCCFAPGPITVEISWP